MNDLYNKNYAQMYIERTLTSPYTIYKNKKIANILKQIGSEDIWDLGGNVSGIMKIEGSLRYQIEKFNISYNTIDIVPEYFDPNFALSLRQTKEKIYTERPNFIVCDISKLPFSENSINEVVCADVIEHISNPKQVLQEIYRVMKKNKTLIIVVPSFYKLDSFSLNTIINKRFSSHINKYNSSSWKSLFNEIGFKINEELSQPLGITSGLVYLTWLNSNYVPIKIDDTSDEIYSEYALEFKNVKKLIAKYDEQIDDFLIKNKTELIKCLDNIYNKNIQKVFNQMLDWLTIATRQEQEIFVQFFNQFDLNAITHSDLTKVSQSIKTFQDPYMLGNSILFVLRK